MKLFAIALVLAACGGKQFGPARGYMSFDRDEHTRVLLGERVAVHASWGATCDATPFLSEHEETKACEEYPVSLEVACGAPCKLEPAASSKGYYPVVTVSPMAIGPFVIHARYRRIDSRHFDATDYHLDVVPAQRLVLRCLIGSRQDEDCGPNGVPAAMPWITALAIRDNNERLYTSALSINGKRLPPEGMTLADLYPDAREAGGPGVVPGTYDVTVALGSVTQHYRIEAHR
jgi:hypothetical protein